MFTQCREQIEKIIINLTAGLRSDSIAGFLAGVAPSSPMHRLLKLTLYLNDQSVNEWDTILPTYLLEQAVLQNLFDFLNLLATSVLLQNSQIARLLLAAAAPGSTKIMHNYKNVSNRLSATYDHFRQICQRDFLCQILDLSCPDLYQVEQL